ncbi:MAG: CcmD family protein, partial [Proteobacteria bacterium]|nr:CcmD family protein [Pseudomonadota bacterium]
DVDVVEQVVLRSIEILDAGQRRRLTYLFAAYIVVWLVFMIYVLRLEQQQQLLDQRLAQLEIISDAEETDQDQ